MVFDLIKAAHDPAVFSHGGIGRTLHILKRNFYWPSMAKDVRKYVLECDICKSTKSPNVILKPPMGAQSKSDRPFQKLYVDFIGPLPRSKNGNIGIFIVLDHFSKFPFLHTVKSFKTTGINHFLETQIFHLFGVPETIVSDNGTQFKSKSFQNLMSQHGIQHTLTAFYSPQANNSERVNKTIIAAMRAYIKENDHRVWDIHLSEIAASLRNSFHCATKYSPYFSVFGQHMALHGKFYALVRQLNDLEEGTDTIDSCDKLKLIRFAIQANLDKAYEISKKTYNLRTRIVKFRPNEIVFRRNFVQSDKAGHINAKLCPKFVKSKVVRQIGNHYYELMDLDSTKITGIYHAKDILKNQTDK
jgi:hypothetical protein